MLNKLVVGILTCVFVLSLTGIGAAYLLLDCENECCATTHDLPPSSQDFGAATYLMAVCCCSEDTLTRCTVAGNESTEPAVRALSEASRSKQLFGSYMAIHPADSVSNGQRSLDPHWLAFTDRARCGPIFLQNQALLI